MAVYTSLKSVLRSLKLHGKAAATRVLLSVPPSRLPPFCFVVGCGRSGTTVLGDLLKRHSSVQYFREPYHRWVAVDPRTDVTNLHSRRVGRFFLDADDANEEIRERFARVFRPLRVDSRCTVAVEKTPHNVARIGYLETLVPQAKYIHVVRDGLEVAASIERLSRTSPYPFVTLPRYHRWWGRGGAKWTALASEGAARGYCPEEVGRLESNLQRGAYEWVVSVAEASRWEKAIPERFLVVRYSDLVAEPRPTSRRIADFVGLDAGEDWLDECERTIRQGRSSGAVPVLPPRLNDAFERWRVACGFTD